MSETTAHEYDGHNQSVIQNDHVLSTIAELENISAEDEMIDNDQLVAWASKRFDMITDEVIHYVLMNNNGDILRFKPISDILTNIGIIIYEHDRNGNGSKKKNVNGMVSSNGVLKAQKQRLEASKNCLKHWMITRSIMNAMYVGDDQYGPMFAVIVLKRPSSSKRGGVFSFQNISDILARSPQSQHFDTAVEYLAMRLSIIAKDIPSDITQIDDARRSRSNDLGLELSSTNLNLMAKVICDIIVHFGCFEHSFDIKVGKSNQADFYRNDILDSVLYNTTDTSYDMGRFGLSMGDSSSAQNTEDKSYNIDAVKTVLNAIHQRVTDASEILDVITKSVTMDERVRQILSNAAMLRNDNKQREEVVSLLDENIIGDEEYIRLLSFLNPTDRNFQNTDDYDVEDVDFNTDPIARRIFSFWKNIRHYYDIGRENQQNSHPDGVSDSDLHSFEIAKYALRSTSCPVTIMSQASAMNVVKQIHNKRKENNRFVETLLSDLSSAEMNESGLFSPSFSVLCQIAQVVYLYGEGDINKTPCHFVERILERANISIPDDESRSQFILTMMGLAIQRIGHSINMMRYLRSPCVFGTQNTLNNLANDIENMPAMSNVGLTDIHRCGSATRTLPEIIEGTESVEYGIGPHIPELMKRIINATDMLNDIRERARRESKHQKLVGPDDLKNLLQHTAQMETVESLSEMLEKFMSRVIRQKMILAQEKDVLSLTSARDDLISQIETLIQQPLDENTKNMISKNIERQMAKESDKVEERTISFDVSAGLNSGTLTFKRELNEIKNGIKPDTNGSMMDDNRPEGENQTDDLGDNTIDVRTKIPPFVLFLAVKDAIQLTMCAEDGKLWQSIMGEYNGDPDVYNTVEDRQRLLVQWANCVFKNPVITEFILLHIMRRYDTMKNTPSSSQKTHDIISTYDNLLEIDDIDHIQQHGEEMSVGKRKKTRRGGVMKISDARAKKKTKS